MEIFISLDYEVFFGEVSASIDGSLIRSTQKFLNILDKYEAKAIFFVDAGYLFALNRQRNQYKKLDDDFKKITSQLEYLDKRGYEIGLHVHPHWEDCSFDGKKWNMDLKRFKLSDFGKEEAKDIFKKYYHTLQPFCSKQIIAYRAGGWCLEPFSHIREAMYECGIYIDSTVFADGHYQSDTHSFDFRKYPKKEIWEFSNDPSVEDHKGKFLEVPISSNKIPPYLYWKVLFDKLRKKAANTTDGSAVKPSVKAVVKKLLFNTTDAVSIDSLKSCLLLNAFKRKEQMHWNYFCIIGHPKCFTDSTYKNLDSFINYAIGQGHSFSTYSRSFAKSAKKLELAEL